jgi:hypothetical protein
VGQTFCPNVLEAIVLISAMGMVQDGDIVGYKRLQSGGIELLIKTKSKLTVMVQLTPQELEKLRALPNERV